ncbi:AAA family ATPase [Stenotrophomonas cyclobalanopsidis]|uniref:AAA family ATPase n=1 Tax=Stenotrophomonas cyclobalanopsidis TaxID=2771362 RepID=A0ABQ6T462_9GAMM|nr:AAA family ATPase [Stenotrophomonas cyclobalanopsidis]KAA9003472.1 AAA family ATPase [Stenotrophomonas cyclobalanopsidis]
MFNHKGGVSKTTTVFNLGWMLALKGKRVIMADFDPQCNLTGLIGGYRGLEDMQALYGAPQPNNIKDALAPAFESQPRRIEAANCFSVHNDVPNLLLLAGHIGLSEYETTLGLAQELSGSLLPLRNLPGAVRYMLEATAQAHRADYVLVDMSPSVGPMNQNLIATCDHFIVPFHPDYFSSMALDSLSSVLPRWRKWAELAYSLTVLRSADYPFPAPHPTFVGSVIQKFRPRMGAPAQAFQKWVERLKKEMEAVFVPSLEAAGMVNIHDFESRTGLKPWEPMLEVGDFNSLIAYAQEHRVPIFALTAAMLDQQGAVWAQTLSSMTVFKDAFEEFADRVIAVTA